LGLDVKRNVYALLAGLIFGAGLVISGMSNPNKVLNFLDILGPWDASLLFVMAAAIPVAAIGFRFVWRRKQPVCGEVFQNPSGSNVDRNLVLGAALFGVGWGIAGYCPGPAVTALAIVPAEAVVFILAMLAGSFGYSVMRKST
jgi:uncharacterized membrane protein YedE/YeeE